MDRKHSMIFHRPSEKDARMLKISLAFVKTFSDLALYFCRDFYTSLKKPDISTTFEIAVFNTTLSNAEGDVDVLDSWIDIAEYTLIVILFFKNHYSDDPGKLAYALSNPRSQEYETLVCDLWWCLEGLVQNSVKELLHFRSAK